MSTRLPPPDASQRRDAEDEGGTYSPKSFMTAWLLSLFLGMFGADRFYLEKRWSAVAKLVSVGGLFVWWAIDLWILMSAPTDRDKLPLRKPAKVSWVMWGATAGVSLLVVFVFDAAASS